MAPSFQFLSLLSVLCLCGHALGTHVVCSDHCCSYVEGFPVRLKELRTSFFKIRHYYEANDKLEEALLDSRLQNSLQSPFGCNTLDSLLKFYLDIVLPTAINETSSEENDFQPPTYSINNIFSELKIELIRCKKYFSCKKPFDIKELISNYNKMENNGMYKAMGELDLFFNYIEKYLASNRKKH